MTVYWTNDTTKYGEESVTGWNVLGETMTGNAGGGYWNDMMTLTGIANLPFMLPNSYGGSSTTKFCDYGYTPTTFVGTYGCYAFGNNLSSAGQNGLWYRETNDRNRNDQYIHCRIAYTPQ